MNKLLLYWEFYKSTLILNWSFSMALSIIIYPLFLTVLPICVMTAGPIVSLFFKEVSRKNEFYFYYNKGISKISLITTNITLNLITGVFLLIIIHYAKSA